MLRNKRMQWLLLLSRSTILTSSRKNLILTPYQRTTKKMKWRHTQ